MIHLSTSYELGSDTNVFHHVLNPLHYLNHIFGMKWDNTHPYLHSWEETTLLKLAVDQVIQNQIDNDIWFRKQQLAHDRIFQWHDIAVNSS